MVLPFILLDMIDIQNGNIYTNIESILYFMLMIIAITKYLCIAYNQKKLARNIDVAIDDWLSARDDKESWKIMKKYALKSRILTLVLTYLAAVCYIIYIFTILVRNLKQAFLKAPYADRNETNWILFIPAGSLSSTITGSQFVVILIIQILQMAILCSAQCTADCFYFNITLHFTGQLEVLKHKFKKFVNEPDTRTNYRKQLISMVNKHSELMELYQNLESSFHILILFQLVSATVTFALLGLQISFFVKENNQIDIIKGVLVLNYMFIQSLVYAYGGDYLQRESEGIPHELYATSWFTLPLTMMKDVRFAMMRSNIPFRLTGGKFFYVNRETMVYVLRTAASYVSVLRVALRD